MKTLREDIDRNKSLMNIVRLSDLEGVSAWDAKRHVRGVKNLGVYTIEDGILVKRDTEPKMRIATGWGYKSKDVFYLTPEEAESANELLRNARELEFQAKELRNQAKEIYIIKKINR